jgi:hypothetical protein
MGEIFKLNQASLAFKHQIIVQCKSHYLNVTEDTHWISVESLIYKNILTQDYVSQIAFFSYSLTMTFLLRPGTCIVCP